MNTLSRSLLLALLVPLALPGVTAAQCTGLTGRYYSSWSMVDTVITFDPANLVLERTDANIDFWNAPDRYYRWQPISPGDNYGVWWTGYLTIEEAGEYAFGTVSDDGSQVWVDSVLVVDNYESQWWDWEDSIGEGSQAGLYPSGSGRPEQFPGPMYLEAGQYPIEVRFAEGPYYDGIELWWLKPGSGPSDIPYYGDTFHGTGLTVNAATNWEIIPSSAFCPYATAVGPAPAAGLQLLGAAPNPFGQSTALRFALPRATGVEVEIFDLAGRRVRTLARPASAGGEQLLVWDGRDQAGRELPSGVYPYRVHAGGEERSGRLVKLR